MHIPRNLLILITNKNVQVGCDIFPELDYSTVLFIAVSSSQTKEKKKVFLPPVMAVGKKTALRTKKHTLDKKLDDVQRHFSS